ncbi:MAG: DUF4097 family beta strand repeat-containing protein [Myxococcota bacterium]
MSALALVALSLLATESGRVPATALKRISISTTDADLRVSTASIADIEWSGGDDVDFAVEGTELRIHVRQGDTLSVQLPAGRDLAVSTQSGDVALLGRFGDIYCGVTAGDVAIRGRVRGVEVETLNGDLSIDGSADTVRLTSVSGGIKVRGSLGELRARTTSGDLELKGELPQHVQFQTVSGDLSVRGRVKKGGFWQLRSVSGDIALGIDGGAHVSLHTRTGDVTVKGCEVEGHHVEHDINGGGMEIEAFTFSGDLKID